MIGLMNHVRGLTIRAQLGNIIHLPDIPVILELRVEEQDAQVGLAVKEINLVYLRQKRRPARQAQAALLVGHGTLVWQGTHNAV